MVEFIHRVPFGDPSEFTLFGVTHILTMVMSIVVIFLVWKYIALLKESKHEPTIRYIIASYMLLTSVYVILFKVDQGVAWYGYLPEATCALGSVFGAVALLTKNRTSFVLSFFFGWGAITTLVAPNILEGVTRYYFYQFMIRHLLILVSSIYMMKVFDYKLYKKDYLIHVAFILPYAFLVLPINLIVNNPDELNTLYFMRPAVNNVFLDAVYHFNNIVYIIVWILLALLLGYLYGFPFYQDHKKKTS